MGINRPGLHGEDHANGVDPIPGLGALTVEDGITTVFPTNTLEIGAGLVLADGGAGIAQLSSPAYTTYTPVLTAESVDPTLGSSSSSNGIWVQVNKIVHTAGIIDIGAAGFSAGTDAWHITLPVQASSLANVIGVAHVYNQGLTSSGNMLGFTGRNNNTTFVMTFPATSPFGTFSFFGAGVGWTFANHDSINWSLTYRSV